MRYLDKTARVCLALITVVVLAGIFAPWLAPNSPIEADILNKYAAPSREFPLGADHLGRCILSRLIYGIRPTILLSLLTMAATVGLGALIGLSSGYFRGWYDEVVMRICDVMLSFPSQVMILAVVGMLGVGMENVIIANIVIKWSWYARMIRGSVIRHLDKNYLTFARITGSSGSFIIGRHLLPVMAAEIIILASLDTGWVILNISTLSFLGLGVQAPTPEWGAMLSVGREVLRSHPWQMLPPGLAILLMVAAFNLLGDSVRDAIAPKENTGERLA